MGRLGGLIKPRGSTHSGSTSLRGGTAPLVTAVSSYVSLVVVCAAAILVVMFHLGMWNLDSLSSKNPCLVSQSHASRVLTQRYQSGNPHLESGFGPTECAEMGY